MAFNVSAALHRSKICRFSTVTKVLSTKATSDFPKNKVEDLISAQHQQENGVIYDKKPLRILLEADKKYSWCLCGRSHKQPFCDGTHKNEQLKIKQKPVRFMVEETKEYWLCNCKQTASRPFCDGTHKTPIVQEEMVTVLRRNIIGRFNMLKRFCSNDGNDKGVIYDKQPVKIYLQGEKKYWWCACGRSSKQPFCDGTHKKPELKIRQSPVHFEVKSTKEYWLCLCKQTSRRPFCDGTHKSPAVQNATTIAGKTSGK